MIEAPCMGHLVGNLWVDGVLRKSCVEANTANSVLKIATQSLRHHRQSRLQTLKIYEPDFNQNYKFTSISLIKMVLCSKFL